MTSSAASPLTLSIKHAKEVVDECLPDGLSGGPFDSSALEDRLNPVLFGVLSAGRSNASTEMPEQDRVDLWHIVCKLWVRSGSPGKTWKRMRENPNLSPHAQHLRDQIGKLYLALSISSSGLLQNACVVKHNESNKSDQWMVTLRESAR